MTRRRHDYPLVCFGEARLLIDPRNRPWTGTIENLLDETDSPVNEDSSIESNIQAHNELIESRVTELAEDKKTFESLLKIVTDNVQNDHFYKRLSMVLVNETKACQEALMARSQQRTWNPPACFSIKLKKGYA